MGSYTQNKAENLQLLECEAVWLVIQSILAVSKEDVPT